MDMRVDRNREAVNGGVSDAKLPSVCVIETSNNSKVRSSFGRRNMTTAFCAAT
jgi:hypothetical protein